MANLNALIQQRWPAPLLRLLQMAGEVARGRGYCLYVVGGAVRDLLLGRANLDLDLVVDGDGVAVARRLSARLHARAVVHARFGTAKLYYSGGSLDIITARREAYPHPGALPVVQPGNLESDLFRRDFTINALAIRVEPGPFGELIDPYGGQHDLESRILRCLHPRSFVDDATRILRGLRYEQRLGLGWEPATAEAMSRDVAWLDSISSDRLRHELELILKEAHPERVLRRLADVGAMPRLLPSWAGDTELEARLARAREGTPSPSLYLALLVWPLESAQTEEFIARLRFPAKTAHILRHTVELRGKLPRLARDKLRPSYIYGLVAGYSPTAILANALAAESPPDQGPPALGVPGRAFGQARENLHLYLNRLRYVKLSLGGKDLIDMGLEPGPRLGQLLSRLLEARLDGQVASREEELRLVRSWLSP